LLALNNWACFEVRARATSASKFLSNLLLVLTARNFSMTEVLYFGGRVYEKVELVFAISERIILQWEAFPLKNIDSFSLKSAKASSKVIRIDSLTSPLV